MREEAESDAEAEHEQNRGAVQGPRRAAVPGICPLRRTIKVDYWRWAEGEDVRLTVQNTNKSPKNLFFPQLENMVAFNVEGKSIEIIEQELSKEKFVLMGVRACDARSLRRCWTACSWPSRSIRSMPPAAKTARL